MAKYTTKTFIEKAEMVHPAKFNYNSTVYTKWGEKVVITCPIHGDFEQTPREHLSGRGCNACGRVTTREKQVSNTETFIKKARAIHGDKYSYSKVV